MLITRLQNYKQQVEVKSKTKIKTILEDITQNENQTQKPFGTKKFK